MATNFDDAILSSNGFSPTKVDTPLDKRSRIENVSEVPNIPNPFVGMIFYVSSEDKYYRVKSLKSKVVGGITVQNAQVNEYVPFETGGSGTSDYSELENKPSIGDVTLEGNKTLDDLGIASKQSVEGKQDTIKQVNVTVDDATGTPSGSASVSGSTLNIDLKNIKGDTGATGPSNTITIGTVTPSDSTEEASATLTGESPNQVLNLVLPRGKQGNSGVSGDTSEIAVINDLNGGESEAGSIKVLAAEQGKVLKEMISDLNDNFIVSGLFINYGYYNTTSSSIVSSKNWKYTDPITLKKGEKIKVFVKGFTNVRPIILEYINDQKYNVLVSQSIADSEIREYNYTANEDCRIICFSYEGYNDESNYGKILFTSEMICNNYLLVNNSLNDISKKFIFINNFAIYANPNGPESFGNYFSSTVHSRSDYVNISKYAGKKILITVPAKGTSSDNQKLNYGTCFYNINKEVINTSYYEIYVNKDKKVISVILDIPDDAYYIRTTWYLDSDNLGDFKCKIIESDFYKIEELNGDELCSYYTFDNNGVLQSSEDYSCSSLYNCEDCYKMNITIQRSIIKGNAVCFFDKNKEFICSYPTYDSNNQSDVQSINLYIPSDACYCSLVYPSYKNRDKEFKCVIYGNREKSSRR